MRKNLQARDVEKLIMKPLTVAKFHKHPVKSTPNSRWRSGAKKNHTQIPMLPGEDEIDYFGKDMKRKDINLEKAKLAIIRWVASLEDQSMIQRLNEIRKKPEQADWWDEIAEVEKKSIEQGLEDVKAGRVKPHQVVKKVYEEWL